MKNYGPVWMTCKDGEYEACGVFLPGFLDRLTRADEDLTKKQVKILSKILKEIGRGARNMLRIHREINDKRIGRELNQKSIKSFLVSSSLSRKTTDGDSETSSQPAAQEKKKQKSSSKRNKTQQPESDTEGSDDDGAPRIKNPPSSRTILRNFFSYIMVKVEGRDIVYWEWKAG